MLAHFIPRKGKGIMVILLPIVIGVILGIIFDAIKLKDQYILPAALILSAFIIWFYDDGPKIVRNGFKNYRTSNNTLFWIEIKYWAILLGIIGCVVLGSLF